MIAKWTVAIRPCGILFGILFFYFVPTKPQISTPFLFFSAMTIPAVVTAHGTEDRVPGAPTRPHTPFFSAFFTASEGRDAK